MTDIVEEARAMLARLNEGAFAWGNAHANQQGERLLAALADERAAVAIAHERIAAVTAERDALDERMRVVLYAGPSTSLAVAAFDRAKAAEKALAAVTAERDARPAISRSDASGFVSCTMGHRLPSNADLVGAENVRRALRAHAAGSDDGGIDADS